MTARPPAGPVNESGSLFFIVDGEGELLEWGSAVEELTGRDESALASVRLPSLFKLPDCATSALDRAFEAGEATFEAALVTEDGRTAPYEFTAVRMAGYGEEPAAAVTGQRITAAEHEQSNILERMGDGFFALDEAWNVTYLNEQARPILAAAMGRAPEETFIGLNFWEEIPGIVGTRFSEEYHEAMETQEPRSFEAYYEGLDAWFEVRAYPSDTGLSVYFHDVTERRHHREQLAEREQVLRRMYDIIADGDRTFERQVRDLLALGREVVGTDYATFSRIDGTDYVFEMVDGVDDEIEEGSVVPLSATFCEIAASTERTLVAGDIEQNYPESTYRAGFSEMGIACYLGAPVFLEDDVYGTFCFYDRTSREDGFPEWHVTLTDLMSRWISYELQRKQANDRLREQNAKLERFASIVSHDLRNPLNVLDGSLELAEEEGRPEDFERCRQAIARMDALIDDLLVLARAGDDIDEPESVDIRALVDRCWEVVDTADATLNVEAERRIEADETRLRQLLENLLRNAVEHSSTSPDSQTRHDAVEHGSTSSRSQADDAVEHAGDGVTVTVGDLEDGFYVEDDGPGIPPEDREAVLESGYSSTPDGTGFGLAIVKEIADAHGWRLEITESESGGARFEFRGVSRPEE